MDSLPVNILDLGVIALLLIGALIGLALGFVRGGLFVLSWIGAGLATLFGFPEARPLARNYIETVWIADLTTGVVIFLVTLVVLSLISSAIGGWVRGSRLNSLDRSLGLLAGLATSALILMCGSILADTLLPKDQRPAWANEARSLPLIESGADVLRKAVPEKLGLFKKSAGEASRKTKDAIQLKETYDRLVQPTPAESGREDRPGYDSKERRALERTIQGLQ